jgi:hypothetical protein
MESVEVSESAGGIGQERRRLHEVINRVRTAGGKLFQGVPERRAQ